MGTEAGGNRSGGDGPCSGGDFLWQPVLRGQIPGNAQGRLHAYVWKDSCPSRDWGAHRYGCPGDSGASGGGRKGLPGRPGVSRRRDLHGGCGWTFRLPVRAAALPFPPVWLRTLQDSWLSGTQCCQLYGEWGIYQDYRV